MSTSSKSNLKETADDDKPLQITPKKKPIILRIINTLWATRQTRKNDTKNNADLLVKTTIKELIIYIFFLAFVTIITFAMMSTMSFYFTYTLMNLFQNQQTSSGVSFSSMESMSDFWDVNMGPVLDGLYWENWYNGQPATQHGYIYFESKMIGVPRLRQLRVRNGSCVVHSMFKSTISDCYAPYSYFAESKDPFGKYLHDQSNMNDSAFYYQSSSKVNAPIVYGEVSTYGGGGYVKNLAETKDDSMAIFKDLKANTWLDRGTRVVFLDFTVYNGNINLFCMIRLISEFPATGGVIPTALFRTVKLIRYVTPMDYFVLVCEILFAVLIVYYTIEEILEISIHRLNYFKEIFNILDVIIILLSYACIGFDIYRVISVNNLIDSLISSSNTYADFDSLVYWQYMFDNAMAVLAFLSWIKFFKYISFNKTMNQLSETLGRCAKDIIGFSVMFYVIFFAYAQLGFLLFGASTPDYSTFMTTVFTLFRIILGDFDFPTLEANSRIIGPIYFISYVFFVFFVLLNMFLAIINDSYSEVKSDIASSKSDLQIGAYFKRGYDKFLTKMHLKKDKIVDIQQALESADTNTDKVVNFDEWRRELKKRGYSDAEIEAYFAKYDTDGNRHLSHEEQMRMKEDLKSQFSKIDQDMEKMKAEADMEKRLAELEAMENKDNAVAHSEFKILIDRVDTMESSIGNIVNRIDSVLSKLEFIEKAKLKRREAMARILEKLNSSNVDDEVGRVQLQSMIKEELEKWDEPFANSPTNANGYTSRAASPQAAGSPVEQPRSNSAKKAWRQQ